MKQKKSSKTRVCPRCSGRGWLNKSKYSVGRTFEYKVIQFLRERGWKTTRSYGSKGVFDVMAQKDCITLGIQVKSLSGKNKAYLTPKDRLALQNEWLYSNSAITLPYKMYTWTSRKTPPRQIEFSYPMRIIHAYKDGMKIEWRELIGIEWQECSNLIKHKQ